MIDLSKFFITYTPYISSEKQSDQTSIYNPYSAINFDTYDWSNEKVDNIEEPTNLWKSLGWQSSEPEQTDSETSSETSDNAGNGFVSTPVPNNETSSSSTKGSSNVSLRDKEFFEKVDPAVRLTLSQYASQLGINSLEQFELAVQCIIAQCADETGAGTSFQFRHNNPGGLKWTNSNAKYGGYKGNRSPEGDYYTHFSSLTDGIRCQIANFYVNMPRYKGVFVNLKSPTDFAYRVGEKGYYKNKDDVGEKWERKKREYAKNCEYFARQYRKWKYGS